MSKNIILILSLLVLLMTFQFLPSWFFISISTFLIFIFIGIPIYEYFGRNKLYKFIESDLKKHGYKLLSIKRYQEHFGVKFSHQGINYYSKCTYAKSFKFVGEWLDGSPTDIVNKN